MLWLVVLVVLVLLFSFVVAFGAPFLPTLVSRREDIFQLMDLSPGDTMLELGSGDGRILLLAAQKGIHAVGYELNPVLVLYSRLRTWRYRRYITIKWQNYWRASLPPAEGMYVFLHSKYMNKLDKKITQDFSNPVKLVSFAFTIPNREVKAEKNGMFLYEYKKADLLK